MNTNTKKTLGLIGVLAAAGLAVTGCSTGAASATTQSATSQSTAAVSSSAAISPKQAATGELTAYVHYDYAGLNHPSATVWGVRDGGLVLHMEADCSEHATTFPSGVLKDGTISWTDGNSGEPVGTSNATIDGKILRVDGFAPATSDLQEGLSRMKRDCLAAGQEPTWHLFKDVTAKK